MKGSKFMKIIYNRWLPFRGFLAINLFGILFVRGSADDITPRLINHERIHTAQMRELGFVPFYILYILEWLFRLLKKGNAYRNISFEREAYANDGNLDYLGSRRKLAMWRQR